MRAGEGCAERNSTPWAFARGARVQGHVRQLRVLLPGFAQSEHLQQSVQLSDSERTYLWLPGSTDRTISDQVRDTSVTSRLAAGYRVGARRLSRKEDATCVALQLDVRGSNLDLYMKSRRAPKGTHRPTKTTSRRPSSRMLGNHFQPYPTVSFFYRVRLTEDSAHHLLITDPSAFLQREQHVVRGVMRLRPALVTQSRPTDE